MRKFVLLIFLILIFITGCNEKINKEVESKQVQTKKLLNESLLICTNTSSGWSCRENWEEWGHDRSEEEMQIISNLMSKKGTECGTQGGKWVCYGECQDYYPHYCDFPFDDAGKICTSSDQCRGQCEVESKFVFDNFPNRTEYSAVKCIENCTGKCVEYILRECDWWFEVNKGIIEDHTGMFCD